MATDGYLWINAFDHLYLYDIGEPSAERIIKYAMDNSSEAMYEPFRNWVAGKVTEITKDYIYVDDSILCKNPDEGEPDAQDSYTIHRAISISEAIISGGNLLIPE